MSKKFRKPKPSPPKWYWWDNDNCWWCNTRAGCNGCKYLKRYVKIQKDKQNRQEKNWLKTLNIDKFLEEEKEIT